MEEIFEFEGQEYTLAEVQAAADAKSLSIEDYTKQYNISRKAGKTTPPQEEQGVAAEVISAPEIQPTVTDSKPEDISLELPEISIKEKKELPYAVSQFLIKNKLPFTQENVNNAKLKFEENKNRAFSERIIDESGIKKFKNLSYNLFGPDALDYVPGPMVTSRLQAINTAFTTGLKTLYTTPGATGTLSDSVLNLIKEKNNYTELLEKEKEEYKDLIKTQELIKKQPRVTDTDSDSLLDVIAGISGSAADVGVSVVPAIIAGAAASTVSGPIGGAIAGAAVSNTDLLSQFVTDFNIEKAKSLNPELTEEQAVDKLVTEGKTEFYTPAAIAAPAMALEYVGLKGITKYIASKGNITKNLGGLLWASNGEGFTESFQQIPEYYNTAIAKGQSKEKALEEAVDFFQENFFNTYINAAVGTFAFSGVLKGAGYAGRKAWKSAKNMRVAIDEGQMENKISEIAELQQKKYEAKTIELKTAIDEQIKTKIEELDGLAVKAAGIFNFASDKDFNEINDLEELKKKYISKVKEINNKKEEIPAEEYKEVLNIYKQKYLESQSRIKGVVSNVSKNANKSAQEVEKIYQQKGKEGIAEIVELYRPMAERLAMKRRNVPGFDKELLTDEILTGERGILDLINKYDPTANPGVTLPMYVNKFAATRAIEASKRILKTEFETDVTEAKGVTDTTTADTEIETKQAAQQEVKKALAQDLNLSEDTQNEIVTAVEKTLGTKLPAVTDKAFKPALTKGFRTELTNTLKKVFGRTAAYEQFLRDNFEKIYPAIPQETINRKFKEFNEAVVDPETGKQLRERTAEGKKVFKKRDITKAEFVKYFLDAPGNVKGARKTSLAEVIADEVGLDNVLNALAKPEVVEKFKAIQELQGQEVPSNFRAIIAKAINRIDDLISALDEFEKDKSILKSDFGLTIPAIKVLKLFLKGVKSGLKAGLTIEKAISNALKTFDKDSKKEKLAPQEQKVLKEAIKNIPAEDYISKQAEDIINRIDKEYDKLFKIEQSKSIDEVLIPLYKNKAKGKSKAERIELAKDFWSLYWRTFQNVKGTKMKEMYSIINTIFGDDFKFTNKSVDGKKFKANLIDQTKTSEFAKKYKNNKEKTIADQHEQADKNFNKYIGLLNDLKEKYNNKEITIDSVYFLLKATGADMNSVGKKIQRLGENVDIEALNKNATMTLEHNSPFDFTLKNILLPYILNDIKSSNELVSILKLQKLELIDAKKAFELNDKDGLNLKTTMPDGYKITEDPIVRLLKVYPNLKKQKNKEKRTLNKEFNKILEQSTGVKFTETFSPVRATMMGRGKGKKFFIPYSADDFVGLLYATLAKGKVGDQQMEWYQENLLRPFSRGIQQYEAAKQKALRDWMGLKKEVKKDVPGGLKKQNDSGFTNQDSVRLYMWNKQGMEIPGVIKKDIAPAIKAVRTNPKLKGFAERLMALNLEGYPQPGNDWASGDITTDIVSYINGVKRSEFLTEWKTNVDKIFTDKNKNKLKALYGEAYVEALDNMLYRMENGRNRFKDASKVEKAFMQWTNNSVGAIMFFNARSAVLQTLSAVNFINFSDNNPINAGRAFVNQKQYWDDFSELFNSDFLKQRRTGLQTDVNADEIANAAATSKNKARAALSAILKFGFTPTQIADSFAIASGGATFYRNRINTYIKEGLTEKEAKAKAFTDFQEIAEETQQSARPDRISMQQAGSLGRLILAFGNTPMQYARLTKKATLDLINGRGDWKTNISKIAYYSVIQNIIFSALQQGLFALLFDDEDDEETRTRLFRIGNSSVDTLLRGAGVYGATAATVKNMILKIIDESKKSRPDYTKVAIEATAISPPINSKLRKLISAGKTFTYKQSKEKVFTEGFSLENPAFLAAGKVISAGTNLPADRVVQKMDHINTAIQPETELWQSIALALGWSEWDLGMIEKQTKKSKKPKISLKRKLPKKSLMRRKLPK